MLGPLLVGAVLFVTTGSYRIAFAALLIPVILTFAFLIAAQRLFPQPSWLEPQTRSVEPEGFPRVFWIYMIGMGMIALAYADYPLIAYHFSTAHIISTPMIPILYAVAMGTEAIAAIVIGRLFDRIGLVTALVATVLTAGFAPLVFLGNAPLAVLGMVVWGIGMAVQESVVKATVTGMVAARRRATACGLFDTGFGVFWLVGSVALGLLYDQAALALVIFSVVLQLAAIPVLASVWRWHRVVVR